MDNIVFIQNLFTPYRAHFFNSLNKKDPKYVVYYMGKTEKDRNWDYTQIVLSHSYWLDKWGIYFMLKRFHIHINPVLVWKTVFDKNVKEVILGVSYNDLNILALALLKHMGVTKKKYHIWAEANYLTNGARKDSSIKNYIRRFVYSSIDGYFIVPGKMSVITFEKWGFASNRYIFLPNTIDESNYVYLPEKRDNRGGVPVFLMPVRLIENVKGVLNFFVAIGNDNIKRAKFIIAGDGPDAHLYQDFIDHNRLQDHIILKGFCNPKEMNILYNRANGVILPSFSDPSPLSIVEALRFHLPVLCSSHCGNHFEAVNDGVNGYTFSPFSGSDIKDKFETFMSKLSVWSRMGEESWNIFCTTFKTENVVENFVNKMNNIL